MSSFKAIAVILALVAGFAFAEASGDDGYQFAHGDAAVTKLVDFASVTLKPGESGTVAFRPDPTWFRYWSERENGWRTVERGVRVLIGTSSRDLPISL